MRQAQYSYGRLRGCLNRLCAIVRNAAQAVGARDITTHSLRRTFCTLYRDAGAPDRQIMASGGWNTAQMLDYYDMSALAMRGDTGRALDEYLR